MADLQRENYVLKDIVKVKMNDVAPEILSQCNTDMTAIVTEDGTAPTKLLTGTGALIFVALNCSA